MIIKAIIPCRFKSVRLPGKPLKLIDGKPMFWHVYNQSLKSKLISEVIIATDDTRIVRSCNSFGIKSIMTNRKHKTGSDRIAECVNKVKADIYVNIQGDEPLINPSTIDKVINCLIRNFKNDQVVCSNAYIKIDSQKELINPNIVKAIINRVNNNAVYFSRYPAPYNFKGINSKYYKQIGLYAFKKEALKIFKTNKMGYLEKMESVELLRILENDFKIKMVKVSKYSKSVDTIDDLKYIKKLIEKK